MISLGADWMKEILDIVPPENTRHDSYHVVPRATREVDDKNTVGVCVPRAGHP